MLYARAEACGLIKPVSNSFSHSAIVYCTHYAESTTREDIGIQLQTCASFCVIWPLNHIANQVWMQRSTSVTFQHLRHFYVLTESLSCFH